MTYLAAYLIIGLTFASLFGKLLKRNLERNFPRVDDDGEVESFLAERLAVCLSKEVA